MRFAPKINGVESEEILWKYSPKKLGNAPVAELLYVVLDFFASIKKGSSGDVTPRRNLFHIIGNDKNLSFRDS